MEHEKNTVVISTSEYRDLIIEAAKAKEKEADIKNRIAIEKDRFYEKMYRDQIESQRNSYINAVAEADKYKTLYYELKNMLEKPKDRKKHWWN